MKKLIKKDVDEAIRLNKKYYRPNSSGFVSARTSNEAAKIAFGNDTHWVDQIITGLTWKGRNYDEPYSTYYKVLECLGFEIVDKEDSK